MSIDFSHTEIERYDPESNRLWLRSYGLKEGAIARRRLANGTIDKWTAHDVAKYMKTGRGRPVIITPIFDHVADEDLETWLEIQKPYGIGSMEEEVYNKETGAYDMIWEATDERAKKGIKEGYLPRFVSPGIHAKRMSVDPKTGIRHFHEWELVHIAVVKKPAFGSIAVINKTACVGGTKCKEALAAIASTPDLELIDPYELLKQQEIETVKYLKNNSSDITPEDNKGVNMSDNGVNDKKTVPYEEYIGLKQKFDAQETKVTEVLNNTKKISDSLDSVTKERDTLKANEEKRLLADKKTAFQKKLMVALYDDKLSKEELEAKVTAKADNLIERNLEEKDIDDIYGDMIARNTAVLKAQEEAQNSAPSGPSGTGNMPDKNTGLGSSGRTGNNKLQSNIDITLGLVGMKRRFV
jgi:hypothetical protein